MKKSFSRRDFLKVAITSAGGALLVACNQSTQEPSAIPSPAVTNPPAGTGLTLPKEFIVDLAGQPKGWKTNILPPPVKFDPPIEVTVNMDVTPDTRFINGEDEGNNIITRFYKDTIGIQYKPKWTAIRGDASNSKWATAMGSNDLPDFLNWLAEPNLSQLFNGGGLEDITDIWEKTATEYTKQAYRYPDHPMWGPIRKDNRIYGIAVSAAGYNPYGNDNLPFLRADWLEKVGMPMPTTVEELHAVGKAFMEKGLATMGIAALSVFTPQANAWMSGLDPIFGAYGVMPNVWLKGEDGKLVYGSTLEGNKAVLELLNAWYKEGFISPEFITITDPSVTAEPIVNGKVGIFFCPAWGVSWPCVDAIAADPTARWEYTKNPAGPTGRRGRSGSDLHGQVVGFRKGLDPKVIEALIQHMNWRLERERLSYENNDYFTFMGYDQVLAGDKLELGPALTTLYDFSAGGYPAATNNLNAFAISRASREKVLAKDKSQWNLMETFLYSDPLKLQEVGGYDLCDETKAEQMNTLFTGRLSADSQEKWTAMGVFENPIFAQIIAGEKPLSYFDEFVKEWKSMGGDQITAEVNEWYANN